MKKYAFFLPQFYEIEENNKWWGKGFTEWTNVKNARSLYPGHLQPKHPLNNSYYNLLNKDTVVWQTNLMNEYHIDGLIYYHYYFSGKLLMEKPAENLLNWKDIPQNFFFCWANHSFTRGNGSGEMLLEQRYGDKSEWEKHFCYLLPFFQDVRYLKDENKPVFMLFKSDFPERKSMFEYFDRRCREEGFSGLCLIESYHGEDWPEGFSKFKDQRSSCTDYIFLREPAFSNFVYKFSVHNKLKGKITEIHFKLSRHGFLKKPVVYNGDDILKAEMDTEPTGIDVIHGLSFCWDNTPRYDKRGYVIDPISHELYNEYMTRRKNDKYLFINAWNEWSEGMVLEPTKEDGYKYLQWIKDSDNT